MYAGIIIDISIEKLDRIFEYAIPEAMLPFVEPGCAVMVPFGKGNTLRKGYVIELRETPEFPPERIKPVQELCEKAISPEGKILELAGWMKKQYGSTMANCLKTVLPVKQKKREVTYKYVETSVSEERIREEISSANPRVHASRIKLLEELLTAGKLPLAMVQEKLGVSLSVVQTLEKRGLVKISEERRYRNPVAKQSPLLKRHTLSQEQQAAVDGISQDMERGESQVSLIFGVTGSGKTEVYMELIEKAVAAGKQAIVLIPEISLTFQMLMRFYARFNDRVSVMHSRLSDGERYDQYERARKGELDIIIGPRSALFTPFQNLGIIVIDEEHESSYKSEKMPKYHAREVAEYIAKREHAQLVLGSATPSLESYSRALGGEYRLHRLTGRNGSAKLPEVSCVDMRGELKAGNKSFFSRRLKEELTETFARGEQAMLFINRRGYAGFVSCRECGYVLKCPHCEVSLSQHGGAGREKLVCHYCGYEREPVKICPDCGSKYIAGFRAGTERMEQELKKEYPSVRVLRMDADTTGKKDDYDRILSAFSSGEADVLVGTQMIVKGHDFANVTLVGILAADLSLFQADYRSAERTFQLIVQACGRAGRGEKKGRVVIQTYKPEHYSIRHASKQDYESFYEEEMMYRSLLGYPPAGHMLSIQVFSQEEERGQEALAVFADRIKKEFGNLFCGQGLQPDGQGSQADGQGFQPEGQSFQPEGQSFQSESEAEGRKESGGLELSAQVTLVGPAKAVFSKLRDIYRTVLYVKCGSYETLVAIKDMLEAGAGAVLTERESLQFDFDPMSMF